MKKVVCIVGSYKWNERDSLTAAYALESIFVKLNPKEHRIISGECHKGGIDIWAKQMAKEKGFEYQGYPPREHNVKEYMIRNKAMADDCNILFRIKSLTSTTRGSGKTLDWAIKNGAECYEIIIKDGHAEMHKKC